MKGLLFIGILLGLATAAVSQPAAYRWVREVQAADSGSLQRIPLPPELYRRVRNDWADLRLIQVQNGDTAEVPYRLRSLGDAVSLRELPVRLIRSENLTRESFATFRLDASWPVNRLDLDLDPAQYDVRASVQASRNRIRWHALGDTARLQGIGQGSAQYQQVTLHFPDTAATFLRVRLDDPRIRIRGAKAYFEERWPGTYQALGVDDVDVSVPDDSLGPLRVRLTLDHRAPVHKLRFSFRPGLPFVLGGDVRCLGQSVRTHGGSRDIWEYESPVLISSLDTAAVLLGDGCFTYVIEAEFRTQGMQVPDFEGIQVFAAAHELLARLEPGTQYLLLYGDPEASKPRMDRTGLDAAPGERLPSATVGSEHSLAGGLQGVYDELDVYARAGLLLVAVLILLMLLVWLLRWIRRRRV